MEFHIGVIYVPKKMDVLWVTAGLQRRGWYNRQITHLKEKNVFTAVGSRSHPSKETADFFEQLKKKKETWR